MSEILVVDDDDDLAEVTTLILEANGHRVRRASDGHEGLRQLEQGLPDVIVLDVEMPHLTGPEMAYSMLIYDAGQERVPIVLMSGAVGVDAIARQVGTPYYLGKPASAGLLREMVERALAERRPPHPVDPRLFR